jgi:hypothetical protein
MDDDFYGDYRDNLIDEGSRVDQAWMDLAQEQLDNDVDRRLRGSMGINPKFDMEPEGQGRDAA